MLKPEDLVASILKESTNPNSVELKVLLQQLSEAVQSSPELDLFIGPVLELLPCHNSDVKRVAYAVLPRICESHPNVALLAANTITKDCADPNPLVKCSALSALCSLPQLFEHTNKVLRKSLEDGNPRVRHCAVMGCGKLFKKIPDALNEHGYVNRLYECIRDSDPIVVTTALLVLDSALASEGGVVINRNIASYLLKRLSDFPDLQLANILQVLGKYTPSSEEELFQELSIMDPYLKYSTSAAVTVSCIKLFLRLIDKDYSHLSNDIIERTSPLLEDFLRPSFPKASTNIVLDFLIEMIYQKKSEWLQGFGKSYSLFFINEKDDHKIANKKFLILPHVCNEENYKNVLYMLEEKHCRNLKTSKEAITCLSSIARCLPAAAHDCLKVFLSLLDSKNDEICEQVLTVLQYIEMHLYDQEIIKCLLYKIFSTTSIGDNAATVPIRIVLLADFGDLVGSWSPHILESFVQNFETYDDETKLLILRASIKMFLKMPARCQHILGEVFEKCLDAPESDTEPSLDLQIKARKYYHLLKNDVELVKKMLLGH